MDRLTMTAAILAAAAFASPAAVAQEQAAPPGASTVLACTNAGTRYSVGEFACIAACHQQRRLARCDVASDSASWTYVSEACPSAMINPPWPSDWSEPPSVTAMSPRPVAVNRSERPAAVPKTLMFGSFTLAQLAGR